MPSTFNDARFMLSAPRLRDCPPPGPPEIAFAGRSNAGKSSVLNRLTGRRQLARTSKTPGRTQALNFFECGGEGEQATGRLVDLPGYGYAKVPLKMLASWGAHIDAYLSGREVLAGVVLVADVRHALKPFDASMVQWSLASGVPLLVLLNKADKLKRGAAADRLAAVTRQLRTLSPEPAADPGTRGIRVQLFSATTGQGQDAALEVLHGWLASGSPRAT